ncbi:hypothetical protein MBANPS3_005807 [Mucor bainieri]
MQNLHKDLSWDYLPLEVWLIILKHVGNLTQLAKCRLVCKAWNPLAERAMFSQYLIINTKTLTQLYEYLVRKPHLGRCIRSLYLDYDTKNAPYFSQFLRLAFTPNIEAVDGLFDDDGFKTMLDIAKQSTQKYSKLKSLPLTMFIGDTDHYLEALLYFRETLTSVDLSDNENTAQRIFNRLGEFHRLTKLRLYIHGSTDRDCLSKLERLLKQCRRLRELELTTYVPLANSMGSEELQSWITSNVEIHPSQFRLCLPEVDHPHVIDYLLYKYPNATAAILGSDFVEHSDNATVEHCLELVKNTNFVALTMWGIEDVERLDLVVRAMRSRYNYLDIRKDGRVDAVAEVTARRYISQETSEFEMTAYSNLSLYQAVKMIGNVTTLDIDFTEIADSPTDEELASHLYPLLTILPDVDELKIIDAYIQHQPALVENLVLQCLTSIHICGAIIDTGVLPALSKIAPRLKRLTLDTCILDVQCYQNHCIDLPQTYLHTLSLLATNSVWNRLGSSEITKLRNQETRYYALKPDMKSQSKQITKEDYQHNVGKWPRIEITCNSLNRLKLDLGALAIVIDLKKKDLIRKLGDWQKDKQFALACHLHQA